MQARWSAGLALGIVLSGAVACVPPDVPPPVEPVVQAPPEPTPPPPVIGPKAVWRPDPLPCDTPRAAAALTAACLQKAMADRGAAAEAQAFAASQGWTAVLTYRGNEGKVVSGIVTSLPTSRPLAERPVLLNGAPSVIDVMDLWRKQMSPGLKRKYPTGIDDAVPPFLVKAEKASNGGQRFVYEGEVRECASCMAKARPRMRVVFDKAGRMTGVER